MFNKCKTNLCITSLFCIKNLRNSYTKLNFAMFLIIILYFMPRKKKKKISIEEIKSRAPKIIFYTDKLRINLSSMKSLSFWFEKYPHGKYVVND